MRVGCVLLFGDDKAQTTPKIFQLPESRDILWDCQVALFLNFKLLYKTQ